jgi:FMN-dependent oxidoreductase (nitrilotriacetate monooxygenase family)
MTMTAERKMNLVASVVTGATVHHHGMWRHPDTANDFLDPASYENLARLLEHGKFDAVFFADGLAIPDMGGHGSHAQIIEHGGAFSLLDPLQVLVIMSRVTQNLGLGLTLSASHIPTYLLARAVGTLDMISKGRAAWNVVTSTMDAEVQNFGADALLPRNVRYDRADEVLEACLKLWASWEEDALVVNKASGQFAVGSKVHCANYQGQWIRTKGPLGVPRSPQDHPVIMQAGASDRGRDFAARWAEIIFAAQSDLESLKAFYDDVKARMEKHGRKPEDCVILASVDIIAAETESIARQKQAYVEELVTPEHGLTIMADYLGFDASQLPLDQQMMDVKTEAGSRGVVENVLRSSGSEGLTVQEVARRFATSVFTPQIVGSPTQVADQLQHLFENGACDGFILAPTTMPGTFEQIVRMVVPELQRRGLFRKEYRHNTLRPTILTAE